MESEMIQAIVQAEEQAKEKIALAHQESEQITQHAKQRVKEIFSDEKMRADFLVKAEADKAREEADSIINLSDTNAIKAGKLIRQKAKENRERAINAVFDVILP